MFDEEDERIIVVLATQAAIAVENARLYDETERKGRELQRLQVIEERERIGKELHDGVIQSLFAVGMRLHGLASSSADAEVARRLEAAVEDVDGAIRDLRNYIFGLRPGILADRQLDQALKEMASEFGGRTGVVTVVDPPRRSGPRLVHHSVRALPVLPRAPVRLVHRRRGLDPRASDRRYAGRVRSGAVRRHLDAHQARRRDR
jgi:signal transduction histidine kinase